MSRNPGGDVSANVYAETKEALTLLVEQALKSPEGRERVANTRSFLFDQLEHAKFNTRRAGELYAIAIDNSVWEFLGGNPARRNVYSDYKHSRLGSDFTSCLVEVFVTETGAVDQRPARRFLHWLLGA
jgi:hypothetical protein